MHKMLNKVPKIQMSDFIGKDYESEIRVNVVKEGEIAFSIRSFVFKAFVNSNNNVEYDMFDADTLELIDGGEIDNDDGDVEVIDIVTFSEDPKIVGQLLNANEIEFYNPDAFNELIYSF